MRSPEPLKAKIGAPTIYTPELSAEICGHIANGVSLRTIAQMEGMPATSTIMLWLAEDREGFSEHYARAKAAQADWLAEDMLSIADEECTTVRADKHAGVKADEDGNVEVIFDSTAVQRNRLRVDTRKWLASKLKPKAYGDKVTNEHTGADGGPIPFQVIERRVVDPT